MNRKQHRIAYWLSALLMALFLTPAGAEVLTPLLAVPVYDGARVILVRSLQDGTKVVVLVKSRRAWSRRRWFEIGAEGIAKGGEMALILPRALTAGEALMVSASRAGEGAATSDPIIVTSLPASLPEPVPLAPYLTTKSQCVGASSYPSATVTARPPSGKQDTADADVLGRAWVLFKKDPQLNIGDMLKLNAALAGKKSGRDASLPAIHYEPLPWHDKVPPPAIARPLEACDRFVNLTGHQPGAEFKISAAGQAAAPSGRFREDDAAKPLETLFGPNCAVEVAGRYFLARELQEGSEIRARQEFKTKGGVVVMPSAGSDYATVGPTAVPATPALPAELFVGGIKIPISGLDPSATVVIRVDADDPAKSRKFENVLPASGPAFGVLPLPEGWVRVRQSKCGKDSALAEVRVKPAPAPPQPPRILTPLYACASTLTVVERTPSAWIRVSVPNGPTLEGTGPQIGVLPQLQDGWKSITAIQEIGGLKSKPSNPVSVEPVLESLPTLQLSGAGVMKGLPFVDICAPVAVAVAETDGKPVRRGATLAIYAAGSLVGAEAATTEAAEARDISVPLAPTFLELGAQVEGTQRLCSVESPRSAPLTVMGKLDFTDPAAHEVDVAKQKPRDVSIAVKIGCPVWSATTVALTSADPSLVEVLAPSKKEIKGGDTSVDFLVRVKSGGTATITASAKSFIEASSAVRGCDWDKSGSPKPVTFTGTKPTGSTDTVTYSGYLFSPAPSDWWRYRVESMHNKSSVTLKFIPSNTCDGLLDKDVLLTLGPNDKLEVPSELRNVNTWTACAKGVSVLDPPPISVDVYYVKWPSECTIKPQ